MTGVTSDQTAGTIRMSGILVGSPDRFTAVFMYHKFINMAKNVHQRITLAQLIKTLSEE